MDPNELIQNIADLVIEIGPRESKASNIRKLQAIIDDAEDLKEFLANGGIPPTVRIVITEQI